MVFGNSPLKLWSQAGGVEIGAETLERWRAGTLRIRFENIASASAEPSSKSMLLQGTVVKILTVPAYEAEDFAAAVRLGNFDNGTVSIVRQFNKECVGLAAPARVELVEFNRNWRRDEAIAWGQANGKENPITVAHLLGIAIGLPNEQRKRHITELSSVSDDDALFIDGHPAWRRLNRDAVEGYWFQGCLVGFVSESA